MGSTGIITVDPISDCSDCVLRALEAMPMVAYLLESSNNSFDHSLLLWVMRGYELLFKDEKADFFRVFKAS